MPHQTFSVVILTYNRKLLLKDCLDSLLRQTSNGAGLEILVADDGSDDGTEELVARYRAAYANIEWLYHAHSGISATRNMGVRAARGDFIAIVADDYILPANYVLTILDFFRERPDAQVVRFKIVGSGRDLGSRISHFYYDVSMRRRIHDESSESAEADFTTLRSLFRKMPTRKEEVTTRHELEASGAAAFRREVFDQVGLFDENLARGEDTDLTVRLRARHIEVYYNPHLPVEHRYEPLMLDTLRKCFESGWSRYLYNRKHAPNPNGKDWKINTPAMARFGALLNALRHLETPGQFVLYAPFMVLFEGVNKLGYACAWMASWRRSGKEASSPTVTRT